jgi:hypothetical protein
MTEPTSGRETLVERVYRSPMVAANAIAGEFIKDDPIRRAELARAILCAIGDESIHATREAGERLQRHINLVLAEGTKQ